MTLATVAGPNANAEQWFTQLNALQVSRIETDLEWVWRRMQERQQYITDLFHVNQKELTGTAADLSTFADLFYGIPADRQREVMEQIIPIPSREFVELMGGGYGRLLLAHCPVDARGYVDCR